MRCIRTVLRTVPTQHIRKALPVLYHCSPLKMSPQIWFTRSMSFCIVLLDILELMGNHTPETVPWFHVATSHCADSNQCGSPPAPALSSKKGQKEISLGQGPLHHRPLALHPRRKHPPRLRSGQPQQADWPLSKGALSGRGTELLVSSGGFHPRLEEELLAERELGSSPCPPGAGTKPRSSSGSGDSVRGVGEAWSRWEQPGYLLPSPHRPFRQSPRGRHSRVSNMAFPQVMSPSAFPAGSKSCRTAPTTAPP